MKKRIFTVLLVAAMTVSLAACAGTVGNNAGKKVGETLAGQSASKETAESEAASKETPGKNTPERAASDEKASGGNTSEQSVVEWNCGTSGSVFLAVVEEKGYLKDEGITTEYIEANTNADAVTLLATGKMGVVSNVGISNPLQQIMSGVDLTIFGGHMAEDCTPVVARAGAEWNGTEFFIDRRAAVNPSYFAFTGAVMDLGYDNPFEAVDWEIYSDYSDALAAAIRGDVEYALMGTGQSLAVQEVAKNRETDIVDYQSEIMENYPCRGMEGQTQWVKDNPNTAKAVIRALLRTQSCYGSNKEEAVKLHAAKIKTTKEYVVAYMSDDEYYFVSVDPPKNSVRRTWDILDKTRFLDEKTKEINIDDHINTKLYEEALGEAAEAYGGEVPEFYQNMKTFFEESDK